MNGAFIAPSVVQKDCIYPWEDMSLSIFCKRLFLVAKNSGYTGTLDEFKQHFGEYLQRIADGEGGTTYPTYAGPFDVTPMVDMNQILHTQETIVLQNIQVDPIPYYETSNPVGGQTVYIGE